MHNLLRSENTRALCILLLMLIAAFFDVVFLGKTFKVTTANSQALPEGVYGQLDNKPKFIPVNGSDSPVLEEPVYEFLKNNFRKGIFPLWNPHQATGYPLIGMIQVGFFYPLNLILYLLPRVIAWDIFILVRIFLAGAFVYWLMRTFDFGEMPSLCSAITFMLSGPLVLLQYWTVNVDILLPVLCIALERLVKKNSASNTAFLALVGALTIHGGHPEHIFLVNAFGLFFFAHRLYVNRTGVNAGGCVVSYILAYLLAAGLAAVVLLPFFKNLLFEFWSGHPPKVGLLMEEQRGRAITLALPHFFQKAPVTYKWQFAGWWGGYLGTIPLGLAFLSLFHKNNKGLNIFFAASTFIIIGKQYGLPVINWIGYLPIFSMCRYAIHTPAIAAFCVAVCAGMGVDAILSKKKCFKLALIYSGLLCIITGIHLIVLRKTVDTDLALKASLFAMLLVTVFQLLLYLKEKKNLSRLTLAWLLVFLLFAELFSYIHRERPRRFDSFAKVPYIELLKSSPVRLRSYGIFWAFYPNTATGFGVDDLGYFFGLVPKRFVHFVNALLLPDHFRDDLRPPALRAIPITGKRHILDLLNVRHIIAPDEKRLSTLLTNFEKMRKNMNIVYSNEVSVMERSGAYPRTFIVHRAVFEPDEEKSLKLIEDFGPQIRGIAVINNALIPEVMELLKKTPAQDESFSRITDYSPNRVTIEAVMENPGFLVFSDAYHPDWAVTVNGKESKIFRTNYLLRSVFLPKGRFIIQFDFKPPSFQIGAVVSLCSLLLLCALFMTGRLKRS